MHIPRTKICGITRAEDAQIALEAGADAIGLVFYGPSPRVVSIERARTIANIVGPFVSVTALFVDPSVQEVEHVLQQVPIALLQFHGNETAEFCQQFQRPWMKAIRVQSQTDIPKAIGIYGNAAALLFDTYTADVQGGSGEVFEWGLVSRDKLPASCHQPIVLAGGLHAENVGLAIAQVQPYGVDVSSGVESQPGIKDAKRMRAFIKAARVAN